MITDRLVRFYGDASPAYRNFEFKPGPLIDMPATPQPRLSTFQRFSRNPDDDRGDFQVIFRSINTDDSLQNRTQKMLDRRRELLHVKTKMANTLFQNGAPSTAMIHKYRVDANDDGSNATLHQELVNRIKDLTVRLSGAQVWEPRVDFTLRRITEPRKVIDCLGNVVKKLSGPDGKEMNASQELEAAVAELSAKKELYDPVTLEKKPIEIFARLSYDNTQTLGQRLPPRISGTHFAKVLAGGGGWGVNAGILALDPEVVQGYIPGGEQRKFGGSAPTPILKKWITFYYSDPMKSTSRSRKDSSLGQWKITMVGRNDTFSPDIMPSATNPPSEPIATEPSGETAADSKEAASQSSTQEASEQDSTQEAAEQGSTASEQSSTQEASEQVSTQEAPEQDPAQKAPEQSPAEEATEQDSTQEASKHDSTQEASEQSSAQEAPEQDSTEAAPPAETADPPKKARYPAQILQTGSDTALWINGRKMDIPMFSIQMDLLVEIGEDATPAIRYVKQNDEPLPKGLMLKVRKQSKKYPYKRGRMPKDVNPPRHVLSLMGRRFSLEGRKYEAEIQKARSGGDNQEVIEGEDERKCQEDLKALVFLNELKQKTIEPDTSTDTIMTFLELKKLQERRDQLVEAETRPNVVSQEINKKEIHDIQEDARTNDLASLQPPPAEPNKQRSLSNVSDENQGDRKSDVVSQETTKDATAQSHRKDDSFSSQPSPSELTEQPTGSAANGEKLGDSELKSDKKIDQ
ncbi:hypothetical protein TWF506_008798 [Arthrobotrys conoides]